MVHNTSHSLCASHYLLSSRPILHTCEPSSCRVWLFFSLIFLFHEIQTMLHAIIDLLFLFLWLLLSEHTSPSRHIAHSMNINAELWFSFGNTQHRQRQSEWYYTFHNPHGAFGYFICETPSLAPRRSKRVALLWYIYTSHSNRISSEIELWWQNGYRWRQPTTSMCTHTHSHSNSIDDSHFGVSSNWLTILLYN